MNCVRQSCHDETNVLQETAAAGFTGMSQCSAPMKQLPTMLQLNLYKMYILSDDQTFDEMTCGRFSRLSFQNKIIWLIWSDLNNSPMYCS